MEFFLKGISLNIKVILMYKCIAILFILSFNSNFALGQLVNKEIKIRLLQSNKTISSKQVILIQTDSLIISTTYVIFTNHLKKIITPNKIYKNAIDSIYKAVKQDTFNIAVNRLNKLSYNLKQKLNYVVGDLLQLGKCFAYNKITKHSIKNVNIVENGGYDYGAIGKKYYLGEILLLDNAEIIF